MARQQTREQVRRNLRQRESDTRFQHELKEMQETQDLRKVDDDVEDAATLYEWYAVEHEHQEKSPRWYLIFAVATAVIVAFFLFFANIIGALTTALVAGLVYYIAQQEPATVRYRIMVDGVAIGNTLYHFKDLDAFNIVYEPGEAKTVILRSKRKFAPYVHMEIGETDPVEIRDVLLEFVTEDQTIEEPVTDVIARRLGF